MPPLRPGSRLSVSGIPRSVAATPALRRSAVQETPLGKIQPVFDGFDLAENSEWIDPTSVNPSPEDSAPSRPSAPSLPTFESYDSVPRNTGFMGRPPRSSRKPPPPPPDFTRQASPELEAPGPSALKRPSPLGELQNMETPSRKRLVAERRKGIDPGTPLVYDKPQPEPEVQPKPELPKPEESVDHSRANRSVALERLRQPGKRVVIAMGSGGRLMTRAERAASSGRGSMGPRQSIEPQLPPPQIVKMTRKPSASLPPVQELSVASEQSAHSSNGSDLAHHSGPAKLPRDAFLANLDVPPILPSSTPAASKVRARSTGLFFLDEPTIAYPDDVSSSWIADTPQRGQSPYSSEEVPRRASAAHVTREWASPALPDDTAEGAAEDWSLRTAVPHVPSPPVFDAMVETQQGATYPLVVEEQPAEEQHELIEEERAEEQQAGDQQMDEPQPDSSYLAATSMIFNFVTSLWPSTSRPAAAQPEAAPAPEMLEIKEAKPVTMSHAGKASTKPAPARKAAKKPYARPAPSVPTRTRAPIAQPPPLAESKPTRAPRAKPLSRPPAFPPPPTREPSARTARVADQQQPIPSYRAPTAAAASKARPPPAVSDPPALRPVRQPLAPVRRFEAQDAGPSKSAFVAAAIARLPKPGTSNSPALPTRVRDAERARDLAVKRALFDKFGEPPSAFTALSRAHQPRPPVTTGSTPGRASRARAAARAEFDAGVALRAAEREAREAEMAKVQAEIEADLDRKNRQAAVVRAHPLPAMYSRK